MAKGASINPKDFSDSRFLKATQQYKPDKDDPKSRFSVSGFPTTLLNTIYYVLPPRLGTSWKSSHATVERFLFNLGLPFLDNDTLGCQVYCDKMAEATSEDNFELQAKLRAYKFSYDVDCMRILGGKEVCQGGTKLQCLARDTMWIKDISIRLASLEMSPLVTLGIVYALSVDDDYQIVPAGTVRKCQKVVQDFRDRVRFWEQELRELD